jgi:peptidoglycan/LPS O-acetylase OafA/YrhL
MIVLATVGAGASLLVAVASFELFEKQFLRLKDRFAPSERGHVADDLNRVAAKV